MSLDIGELQNEQKRLKSTTGQGDFLEKFVKMPDGNGYVVNRLLPPAAPGMFERERSPFFQATRIHRLNGRSYHCLRELADSKWVGDCPVCRYYSHLWKESEKLPPAEAEAKQNLARQLKAIERYYYNVMVRQVLNPQTNEMDKNVGPKILSVGKTVHNMIIRAIVGDEDIGEKALGDVTDLKQGRDFRLVKVMRKGSNGQNYPNYNDSKFLDPEPLGEPTEIKKWLSKLHDLTELRHTVELDELKHQLKVHLGLEKDTETDFDPTEFEQSNAEGDSPVATVVQESAPEEASSEPAETPSEPAETPSEPADEAPVPEEGSESLAGDEFYDALKGLQDL